MSIPSGPSRKSRLRARGTVIPPRTAVPVEAAEPTEAYEYEAAEPYAEASVDALAPVESYPPEVQAAENEGVPPQSDLLIGKFLPPRDWEPVKPKYWLWLIGGLSLFLAGGGAGYWFSEARSATAARARPVSQEPAAPTMGGPIAPAVEADLDRAFAARASGHFDEARQQFAALAAKHPEWPAMLPEVAYACIFQGDNDGAAQALRPLLARGTGEAADGYFILSISDLTSKNFTEAERKLAAAVAINPTKSNFYYFWGETLRQDGKPQEASEKFRAALARNDLETNDNLYQLKLWLSELQVDDIAKQAGTEIDTELALPTPRTCAFAAAAGRAVKAGDFRAAADFLDHTRRGMDRPVFRMVLEDPTFLQESWRPELKPFYATDMAAPSSAEPSTTAASAASPTPKPASSPAR